MPDLPTCQYPIPSTRFLSLRLTRQTPSGIKPFLQITCRANCRIPVWNDENQSAEGCRLVCAVFPVGCGSADRFGKGPTGKYVVVIDPAHGEGRRVSLTRSVSEKRHHPCVATLIKRNLEDSKP